MVGSGTDVRVRSQEGKLQAIGGDPRGSKEKEKKQQEEMTSSD
jgi:hypothetical protein